MGTGIKQNPGTKGKGLKRVCHVRQGWDQGRRLSCRSALKTHDLGLSIQEDQPEVRGMVRESLAQR